MAIAGALHPMSSGPKPPVQIILISGTSWTVPSDWNNADNKIECIGAGGIATTSAGGGGGAYAKASNVALTPGASVTVHIGSPSSTASVAATWMVSTATVSAAGAIGVTAGNASSCVGTVKYSGGAGASGLVSFNYGPGTVTKYPGGGGAAGPYGDGLPGNKGIADSNAIGGLGGAGGGGSGGSPGDSPGTNGAEWGAAGSGAGGTGSWRTTQATLPGNSGATGGNYGGGGGSARNVSPNFLGQGAPGVIVITYTPA